MLCIRVCLRLEPFLKPLKLEISRHQNWQHMTNRCMKVIFKKIFTEHAICVWPSKGILYRGFKSVLMTATGGGFPGSEIKTGADGDEPRKLTDVAEEKFQKE